MPADSHHVMRFLTNHTDTFTLSGMTHTLNVCVNQLSYDCTQQKLRYEPATVSNKQYNRYKEKSPKKLTKNTRG